MKPRRKANARASSGRASTASKSRPSRADVSDASFARTLDQAKRASTLQLLFRAARLLDEEALRRAAARPGHPRLRRSHASLFPHIDLEGTRITELAERLGVSKQAVSQLVDDLEHMGVLARVPDPDDARAKRVVFTALGRSGLLDGLEVLGSVEHELAARVGAREMEQLKKTLTSVLGVVDELTSQRDHLHRDPSA